MSAFFLIAVLSQCLAAFPGVAASDSPERLKIKDMLTAGLSPTTATATQDVTVSKLKGLEPIRFVFEHGTWPEPIRVERRPAFFCVSIDRGEIARAFFLLDAAIVCQDSGACSRFDAYLDVLNAPTCKGTALPLFEEVIHEAATPAMQSWSMTRPYAQKAFEFTQTLMLSIQLHEMAHGFLGHIEEDRPSRGPAQTRREESEADGFAAFVTRLAGFDDLGGAIFLRDAMVGQEKRPGLLTHEPARCRWDLLRTSLSEWQRKHRDVAGDLDLSVLGEAADLAPSAADDLWSAALRVPAATECKDHAAGAAAGMRMAARYFTQDTEISTIDEWGKTCFDFN